MRMTFAFCVAAAAGLALATPAGAQFEQRNIRLSNGVAADHPNAVGVKALNACLQAKTGGKFKIQDFWGGALGGDLQATQALRAGTQEMVVPSTSPLVGILPALGVFDLPFLIANEKEADAIFDGDFGKYINSLLPAVGLVNLAWWENGFRNTTNSRRAITKWEDFNGVRLRVMQNNIFLDTFKTMGANAVPMNFGEVFTALESKAIDGQENPFVTIETSKFYEVQKYLSITNHAYNALSRDVFEAAVGQAQRRRAEGSAGLCHGLGRSRSVTRSAPAMPRAIDFLKKAGIQINELSPAEQDRIREKVKEVYERHADTIGRDVVNKMLAEIKKIRGK